MEGTNKTSCILVVTRDGLQVNPISSWAFWVISVLVMYGITSNLLMLIGVWKTSKKLKLAHKLCIMLCVVDVVLTITVTVSFFYPYMMSVSSTSECLSIDKVLELAKDFLYLLEDLVFLHIVILRYHSIKSPLKFNQRYLQQIKHIYIGLIVSVMIISGFTIYQHFSVDGKSTSISDLVACSFTILVVILTTTVNVRLLFWLNKSLKNGTHQCSNTAICKHKQAVVTLLLITLVSVVTAVFWAILLGIIIDHTIKGIFIDTIQKKESNRIYMDIWLLFKAGVNSHIYVHRCKRIRTLYSSWLCYSCKNTREE